jgi:putative transposase
MAMRKTQFAPGEHYHIYGRGVSKQNIFLDTRDYVRFLFIILYFQSPIIINNISAIVTNFIKHKIFNISEKSKSNILKSRKVKLVSFTLMPNHFHLILLELEECGISEYMQRVLTAYAKYFNTKYEKTGHVFQGPFQASHVDKNEYLLYLSAYIHRNVREIAKWKNKEYNYSWSSYQDCVGENRWGELLDNDIIIGQFKDGNEYKRFVHTSGAKEKLDEEILLD